MPSSPRKKMEDVFTFQVRLGYNGTFIQKIKGNDIKSSHEVSGLKSFQTAGPALTYCEGLKNCEPSLVKVQWLLESATSYQPKKIDREGYCLTVTNFQGMKVVISSWKKGKRPQVHAFRRSVYKGQPCPYFPSYGMSEWKRIYSSYEEAQSKISTLHEIYDMMADPLISKATPSNARVGSYQVRKRFEEMGQPVPPENTTEWEDMKIKLENEWCEEKLAKAEHLRNISINVEKVILKTVKETDVTELLMR